MESRQVVSIKRYSELLAQFIIRLTRFYEGHNEQLDQQLYILRGHLSGQPNFTLSLLSINKINHLLQDSQFSVKEHTEKCVQELEKSVKQLQSELQSGDELYSECTQLLMQLDAPLPSSSALKHLTSGTLSLLSAARQLNQNNKQIHPLSDPADTAQLHQKMLDELTQLTLNYAKKYPEDQLLQELLNRLQSGVSEDELLQSCIVLLRLFVRESIHDASMTGKVLQSLHRALDEVNQNARQSLQKTTASIETRKQHHRKIQAELEHMEDEVKQTDSLDALKQKTTAYIQSVASSLSVQHHQDQEQQATLVELLVQMQSQLSLLQKQTQTYRKKLAEQAQASQTDPLTRLPNRQAYNKQIELACERAGHTQQCLAMAILDIDYFKTINDRFGHSAGDKTLQLVANHLRNHLTSKDFIARWGGEEFILLFADTAPPKLADKLEKIRTSLEQLPLKFKQEKITLSASIGGTYFQRGETPEQLFERADRLLYKAKHAGRNCVVTD
ncbi:diguanylate cyclase [Alteromonas aestuariivivens]|uniref:diguanylate cyclase n=1 Tax=Alteromonas aestuariivivens TaxID=1938339 RepID=A0A3D8M3S6_9ALTE|nr:GGDEF domain-containing protein [Alteromonas aestuariivivens]RDV24383.1 diguanylate cyclase [Alteromonas aestuariivivens]